MDIRKSIVFFLILLIISTAGFGCGGGSKSNSSNNSSFIAAAVNTNPIIELTKDTDISVSSFNDYHIYSLISSQPDDQPESNVAPTTFNGFTITAKFQASSTKSVAINNSYSSEVYSSKQIAFDSMMRQRENSLLASKTPQLSKTSSILKSVAPSDITIGTPWPAVNIYDSNENLHQINATCQLVSGHAYFFVDNNDTESMKNYLPDYGTAFDSIYATNHEKFGTEKDSDTNGKIIIIFSDQLSNGLLGYFNSRDRYDSAIHPDSNEGAILYITTDSKYQGDVVKATMAHEFQHMIYFDQHAKYNVETSYLWLNEALSQAAEYYNGYFTNHNAWMKSFLQGGWSGYQKYAVPLSLTYWTDYNYGYGALFIRYLIAKYGDNAIKNMCSSQYVGITAVENATGNGFNTIFNNFVHALVLSGLSDGGKQTIYNFGDLDLQSLQTNDRGGLLYAGPYDVGYEISGTKFPPYSICFVRWQGSFGTMNLTGNTMVGTAFGISR